MLAKVSVARLSCQVWDASTDQSERVPSDAPIPPSSCGTSSSNGKAARSCSGSWIWWSLR